GFASVRGEGGRIARLVHAELTCEPGVKLRAPAPLGLPLLELRNLGFQLLDAVAAVIADRAANGLALGGERALRVRMLVRTGRPALDLRVELRDALGQERAFQLREPGPKRLAALTQLVELGDERGMPVGVQI